MTIAADAWLGRHLDREVFRVDTAGAPDAAAAAVDAHRGSHPGAMYFAKVSTGDVAAVRALSRVGFYVVDVSVTLARDPGVPDVVSPTGIDVDAVSKDTAAGALDVAGSAFRFTRFHLDPAIPVAVAHRLKRAWIESYVARARGDRLFVATDRRGGVLGFLAALVAERAGRHVAIIDLVAVRTECQRSGAGRALVRAFAAHYAGACDRYEVGTQAANVPSLRFYRGLGFDVASTSYVLHMHVPVPA